MSIIRPILRPILAPVIGQRGGHVVDEQWVYRLDGVSQSWYFDTDIQLKVDDIFKFKYTGPDNPEKDACLIGREANYAGALIYRTRDGGVVESNGVTLFIDGERYLGGAPYPRSEGIMEAEASITSPIRLRTLGAALANSNLPSFTWHFAGIIYDFEIIRDGEIFLSIPLTNKAQGATQLATVGNINAELINYTEDGWEKLEQGAQVTTSDDLRVVTSDDKTITVR